MHVGETNRPLVSSGTLWLDQVIHLGVQADAGDARIPEPQSQVRDFDIPDFPVERYQAFTTFKVPFYHVIPPGWN